MTSIVDSSSCVTWPVDSFSCRSSPLTLILVLCAAKRLRYGANFKKERDKADAPLPLTPQEMLKEKLQQIIDVPELVASEPVLKFLELSPIDDSVSVMLKCVCEQWCCGNDVQAHAAVSS